MTTEATIERQVLDRMLDDFGGDTEFLAEMIDTFFEDAPGQLSAVRDGLAQGDCEAVRRAAHSLKSTSASFGAMALSARCAKLEALTRDGESEQCCALLELIEQQYQQAQAELQTIKSSL